MESCAKEHVLPLSASAQNYVDKIAAYLNTCRLGRIGRERAGGILAWVLNEQSLVVTPDDLGEHTKFGFVLPLYPCR